MFNDVKNDLFDSYGNDDDDDCTNGAVNGRNGSLNFGAYFYTNKLSLSVICYSMTTMTSRYPVPIVFLIRNDDTTTDTQNVATFTLFFIST